MESSSSSSSLPSTSSDVDTDEKTAIQDDSESEFGELSSDEFTSASYISFGEPVFSSNIFVNQPNCYDPSVMASSQNFHTINYPVFKKYGYYIDGIYHSMTKKGSTRSRNTCLWRRGTPRLDTIKEEPELEEEQDIQKRAEKKVKTNEHIE